MSAIGSSRWSSREQCRRQSCKEKVKSLKAEIKGLKGELAPLKTRFAVDMKTAVAGQTRAVHAELAQLKISVEAKERAWRQACDHRKRSEKTARKLSVDNSRLLVMVAEAKASYAALIGKHASSEKKAQSEIRQAAQRERQLKIRLTNVTKAAEAKVDAAEAKADAATEAEAEAEQRATDAEQRVCEAERAADEAISDAEAAAKDAETARHAATDAAYLESVLKAQLARAETKAAEKQAKVVQQRAELERGPRSRSVDEWAALNKEGEKKAAQRETSYLVSFLKSHEFRDKDMAEALNAMGLVEKLFETKPFFTLFYARVQALVLQLQTEHYGEVFGLFLHYEMNLTFDKMHRLNQAASKVYHKGTDRNTSKALLYNPYLKDDPKGRRNFIKVRAPNPAHPTPTHTMLTLLAPVCLGATHRAARLQDGGHQEAHRGNAQRRVRGGRPPGLCLLLRRRATTPCSRFRHGRPARTQDAAAHLLPRRQQQVAPCHPV